MNKILDDKRLTYCLLAANFLVALVTYYTTQADIGPDYYTYVGLADGILHGKYSFYWYLPTYFPDTFRNPGYPLLLAFLRFFSTSIVLVRVFQFIIFFASVFMMLRLIDHYFRRVAIKNVFLILCIISVNIMWYITKVFPEIFMVFLITLSFYLDIKLDGKKWLRYIVLGLLYGYIFQVRPVFLFFPFIKGAIELLQQGKQFPFVRYAVMYLIFFLTMIPYTLWNYNNHGVYSPTSLEGGGGVMHIGYWSFKLPNCTEDRYWVHYFTEEPVSEKDTVKVHANLIKYNREWDVIDSVCKPYLTHNDTVMLKEYDKHPELCATYNTQYTMAREKLLKKYSIQHYLEDIPFTLKTKIYECFRLWYTNPSITRANSTVGKEDKVKTKIPVPFLLSFPLLICAVVFVPWAYFKNKEAFKYLWVPIALCAYFAVIHSPFAIQSRYTIPVRLMYLMVIAYALVTVFLKKPEKTE